MIGSRDSLLFLFSPPSVVVLIDEAIPASLVHWPPHVLPTPRHRCPETGQASATTQKGERSTHTQAGRKARQELGIRRRRWLAPSGLCPRTGTLLPCPPSPHIYQGHGLLPSPLPAYRQWLASEVRAHLLKPGVSWPERHVLSTTSSDDATHHPRKRIALPVRPSLLQSRAARGDLPCPDILPQSSALRCDGETGCT